MVGILNYFGLNNKVLLLFSLFVCILVFQHVDANLINYLQNKIL